MSLDIYVTESEPTTEDCECICGHKHKHTFYKHIEHFNVTHNLVKMADALGIYGIVWRPEENGITKCGDMIKPLEDALLELQSCPMNYDQYEPENNWGSLRGFESFIDAYLFCCKENPEAKIEANR